MEVGAQRRGTGRLCARPPRSCPLALVGTSRSDPQCVSRSLGSPPRRSFQEVLMWSVISVAICRAVFRAAWKCMQTILHVGHKSCRFEQSRTPLRDHRQSKHFPSAGTRTAASCASTAGSGGRWSRRPCRASGTPRRTRGPRAATPDTMEGGRATVKRCRKTVSAPR